MESSEEVTGGLLVAGCDGSELFDEVEEPLDEIAFGIEGEIAFAFDLAVLFRGYHRDDAADFEAFNEAIGVISFVADKRLRRDLSKERLSLGDLVDLAFGEAERQRIAESIDDDVDFGGRAAARAAYGVVLAPFFRAPALC